MIRFSALVGREIQAYFNSAVAYVTLTAFLFIAGLAFYLNMSSYAVQGVPATYYDTMHVLAFIAVLAGPLVTMRLIAEEKNRGTIETLLTAPVRDAEVVLAKFAAAVLFFAFLLVPTLVLVALLARFGAADPGAIAMAYLGMLLMGMALFSIGLFVSALSRSQMVAGFVTLVVVLVLTFLQLATYVVRNRDALWVQIARQINLVENIQPFLRGIFDSRPFLFFLSVVVFFLFGTVSVLGARRWVDRRRAVPVVLLNLLLLGANLVVVNRISFRHFVRRDLTRSARFRIHARTKNLLKNLDERVVVYGNPMESFGGLVRDPTLPPAWQRFRDLMAEFEKRAPGWFRYREIDPTDPEMLKTIQDLFGRPEMNAIYMVVGDPGAEDKPRIARFRIQELYQGDAQSGKIHRFFAEPRLYQKMTELLRGERTRIYFTAGHGELDPTDKTPLGAYLLRRHLEIHQRAELVPINLMTVSAIPADCRLLLVLGPREPLQQEELRRIREYLTAGSGALFVAAAQPGSGLEPLLAEWGILLDLSPVDSPEAPGRVVPVDQFAPHEINVTDLAFYFPAPGLVAAEQDPMKRPNIRCGMLFSSGPASVVLRRIEDPKGGRPKPQWVETTDPKGFPLAAWAERREEGRTRGRMVVWGSVEALRNAWLDREPRLAPYFINTVKWLVEEEQEIVGTEPLEEEPLKLSRGEDLQILIVSLVALPLLGVLLGGVAWFFRRK